MLILSMKGPSLILGTSILLLIVVSHWNFVNAVNPTPTNSTIVKMSTNATVLLANNTNVSQLRTPLLFSQDTSSYINSNLSGR
jgi:hypothetical protein